jgi:hypothetical protein
MNEANNPAAQTQNYALTEMKFRFKKDDLGNLRAPFALQVPVLSVAGIREVLDSDDQKQIKLLMESITDTVRYAVAAEVSEKKDLNADSFDASKFTWQAIANMEKQDRRSIPEEQWKAFLTDYLEVMPAVTGKSKEVIEKHCEIWSKKCRNIASDKKALAKMGGSLAQFVEVTQKAEEFSDVLEFLANRLEKYESAEEVKIDSEAL